MTLTCQASLFFLIYLFILIYGLLHTTHAWRHLLFVKPSEIEIHTYVCIQIMRWMLFLIYHIMQCSALGCYFIGDCGGVATCDFETDLCGLSNVFSDEMDWLRNNGQTPSRRVLIFAKESFCGCYYCFIVYDWFASFSLDGLWWASCHSANRSSMITKVFSLVSQL